MLASWCYLWTPLCPHSFFTTAYIVIICGRRVMASVQDIKIAETLLMLIMLWNEFNTLKLSFHVSNFTIEFSIFSVKAGWIAEMLFMLFFACMLLCNRWNIAEYEAYWLMEIPITNPRGTCWPFLLLKWYVQINQPWLLFFPNKYKEKFVILQSIGII